MAEAVGAGKTGGEQVGGAVEINFVDNKVLQRGEIVVNITPDEASCLRVLAAAQNFTGLKEFRAAGLNITRAELVEVLQGVNYALCTIVGVGDVRPILTRGPVSQREYLLSPIVALKTPEGLITAAKPRSVPARAAMARVATATAGAAPRQTYRPRVATPPRPDPKVTVVEDIDAERTIDERIRFVQELIATNAGLRSPAEIAELLGVEEAVVAAAATANYDSIRPHEGKYSIYAARIIARYLGVNYPE